MVENRHTFENTEVFLPNYWTKWGIPEVHGIDYVPEGMNFLNSEYALRVKDAEERKKTWCMFYEWDWKFDRFWQYPKRYAKWLQTLGGATTPQFSVFANMPLAIQMYSVYRSRWLGAYWESLGIPVIPDVCWGTPSSYDFCFDGLPENATLSIGGRYGCGKELKESSEFYFRLGFAELIKRKHPANILYYGKRKTAPVSDKTNIIIIGELENGNN